MFKTFHIGAEREVCRSTCVFVSVFLFEDCIIYCYLILALITHLENVWSFVQRKELRENEKRIT